MSRPAGAAGLSASPVVTWQAPTPASAAVITHRSVAPSAASALIVSATALKEPGCSRAATVQPPASNTGAAAEETTPHHGTPRTTTTVSQHAPARDLVGLDYSIGHGLGGLRGVEIIAE